MILSDDFLKCVDIIFDNEGVYSNDENDPGGETFFGISRNYHPDWSGWLYVDNIDKEILLNAYSVENLKDNKDLYYLVLEFYYKKFWKKMQLDYIDNFKLKRLLFDSSVNLGVKRASKILQKIIDVKVDGKIGKITLNKLEEFDFETIYLKYKLERIKYYTDLCYKHSKYKIYLLGWINRILKL